MKPGEWRRRDERELLDGALRRVFEPPARVRMPATKVPGARPAAHAEPLGGGSWGWRVMLALAAGLAGFLFLARGERAPVEPESPVARGAARGPIPAPALAPPTGPDLDALYADATRGRGLMATCSAPDELEVVRTELTARCGGALTVRPEAAGILQGPFGSAEWPTGTVLTGYPEGPHGRASVLVAECDTSSMCCLEARVARTGPLHLFSSRLGGFVLTEITPLDEPHLLQYFAEP